MHFAVAHRPKVRARHKDWTMSEVAKFLGKKWRELPEERKDKHRAMAMAEKAKDEQIGLAFPCSGASIGLLMSIGAMLVKCLLFANFQRLRQLGHLLEERGQRQPGWQ